MKQEMELKEQNRSNKKTEKKKETSPMKAIGKWLILLVLLVSLLLNISTYVFPIVRHYGRGMAPTLSENQTLLLYKTSEVKRGDVIAFYYGNNVMVRRVIACGGDQITVDIFGQVSVNGEELEESYILEPSMGQTDITYPYIVPANSYFVMGDAREISMDSRLSEIGCVTKDAMVGKLLFSIWPLKKI